jgi:DNA-binding NtrC family response regulator
MVHGIVRQHDGGIKVESREGEGSTFTIYLPLTREVPVSKNIAARRVLPEGGESILVVEDDKMVLHFLTRALTRAGYRVHTAENASDAVETFASNKIDLLLTDVMIPEKNGMELYAEMKCRRPELKVIFASGYTSDIMSSNEIGNQGLRFVQKPFSRQTLLQIIREVLDSA